ncbi:WhiB family transcriptional regulator [Rhodococcus hoagii]|uniref:Transcriptional regulator WhiB n=1 Tax=Rhodococcus hoagii TaxID=43767 RepID=A0A9Q5A0F8_RHOHA|nr:WhiB family transcriptional regulator [Prescottella equi]MBM4473069.1 WhiB family transcriptional regulator [Prescottella equi]MBM4485572.1 WhiB family transcriptional regulator [Prescottella equi]MBM4492125.1 WhiB family transcriptional regulator [Prescottella equi]MBM4493569.1 WhiB family transcriptional regulator [Prescottella equi]
MSTATCRVQNETSTVSGGLAVVDSARPELPCRVENPDLWFAETPADLERAKALCGQCPVRNRCLRAALDRAEPWGVWGGEIFDQGVVIARKRPRGRPRKNPDQRKALVCA